MEERRCADILRLCFYFKFKRNRNTFQFFTIPIGLFLGGFMVDRVCEPFMSAYGGLSILSTLFGTGKGSGAALMMFILGVSGSLLCICTGKKLKKYQYNEK